MAQTGIVEAGIPAMASMLWARDAPIGPPQRQSREETPKDVHGRMTHGDVIPVFFAPCRFRTQECCYRASQDDFYRDSIAWWHPWLPCVLFLFCVYPLLVPFPPAPRSPKERGDDEQGTSRLDPFQCVTDRNVGSERSQFDKEQSLLWMGQPGMRVLCP
ncbi:hypothetical protein VTK73DRAFT_4673 [Phialemonium thermophilum]|uniref:Uncharacterized protein n=1 Tax=Phialemonium thermophilum TaxID=223376 RepID=A0ABR3V7X6_9PEZI